MQSTPMRKRLSSMSASRIISVARNEIGTVEKPINSNKVKYNTEYYGREVQGSAYPWCCAFVWWVFKKANLSNLFYGGKKTASCITLYNYYKKAGQAVTNYKAGDIVFFNFNGGTKAQHVGIVEKVNSNGTLTTIEGNTGTSNQANGGAVMRRTRQLKHVIGGARPKYAGQSTSTTTTGGNDTVTITLNVLQNGSKGDTVKALQILLNGLGYSCGTADGKFGANTVAAVKKFQSKNKLKADGVVGQATWNALLK